MSSRILIVGNDTEYYELLSNCCTKYDILTLKSIHSLSEFVSSQKVDLILSIISDNFFQEVTLFEQLKQQKGLRDIPIIVIDNSPFPIPNNSRLAFQSGASDYIGNKCDEIELLSRIENQLKQFSRWNEMVIENNNRQETLNLMDKLFLLMDRADNSFIIFDAKGEIEWVNEGFNRLYGYTLDEFKRKFGRSIFEASKNPEIIAKVEHCVKTKKSVNYVAECLTHSGEFKWIQTTFTPIVSADGSIDKFIAIETDITKLKEAEEALNQKNEYMIALTNHLKSSNSLLEEQQKEINTKNLALDEERRKADKLLLNILPFEVWRQLKSKGEVKPRSYKLATVLFLDFVNFSNIAKELAPKDLISILDSYFKAFDDIVDKYYIEKIKTIGDAYMCVGGLPLSNRSNPIDVVLAGLELQQYVKNSQPAECLALGLEWQCRIGIHSGDVIAGVVGKKKFIYDIWGTTVNLAARMQAEGELGRVNISEATYGYVSDFFECEHRGKIKTKGGELVDMYFVNRLKPEYIVDETGLIPNELFNKMMNSL